MELELKLRDESVVMEPTSVNHRSDNCINPIPQKVDYATKIVILSMKTEYSSKL